MKNRILANWRIVYVLLAVSALILASGAPESYGTGG